MAAKSPPPGLSITVERGYLLKALTATTRAVEARNTYPILANVLLTAKPDSLQVRGSDLDIEITSQCPARCTPGAITVPAKTLLEIVRKFPDGAEVLMALEGDKLIVKAGRSRFQLGTIEAGAFPDLDPGKLWPAFQTDLAALFAPVSFAISNEETRYYLNGIYLHISGSNLRAVATDGHRLARHDGDQADGGCIVTGVIVPKKTVALIPPGVVTVELSDRKMRITAGDTVIVSKLVEGTFPDYDRVTPKNNGLVLAVNRAALSDALNRVSIVANDRGGKTVKVAVTEDRLELTCTNAEMGIATEDISVSSSIAFEIGYNSGYLAELIKVAGGKDVTFRWNDAGSPSIITGDNENWLGILMPMRVAA